MEDAFKVHTHWNSYLGSPYFVKAGDKLIEAFKDCTVRGVTISAQGFYGPQGRVVRLPLAMPDMLDTFESFRFGDYRITNFEMESSALAGLSLLLGHKALTCCMVIANRRALSANTGYKSTIDNLIKGVLDRI